MDANRFDRLTQWVGAGNRRQVLGSALAGAAVLLGVGSQEGVAARKRGKPVTTEGPCGNGTIKDNRCKHHGQCCTGFCDKGKGKQPYGRCRCKKAGQSCQEDRNCCATAGQPMSCQDSVCVSTDPAPPPEPICPGLGQACSATKGTACCPDVDPNVVCTGGLNPAKTCQDCTQPMTAAGAYCQASAGNQCCEGNPNCFVGVRVVDSQPACYRTGTCRSEGTPCTSDGDCGVGKECAQGSLAQCGCAGATPTFCGTPCTPA